MNDDLISRKAAIDAINHICPVDTEYDCTLLDRVDVRYVLSDLPSAQPQRVRGRWKRTYLDHEAMGERPSVFYCSGCSQCIAYPTNYCPSCGSYNGGSQDG